MANIDFEALQPEFLSNEKTWLDFMQALSDTIQEQIRDPIAEIEDLRHIIETTDPFIISNTIKELGFDLPADIIQHNAKKLAKSVYMLSLFHELSGTENLAKGISFVLGRDIEMRHLWTNDYANFYTTPGGPMLSEGGDWYLTPHIELGMEIVPSDNNLILPEGRDLADRLLDAYFEFAPINQVVSKFFYMIYIHGVVGIGGKIYFDYVDTGVVGNGNEVIAQLKTLVPDEVYSNDVFPVRTDALVSTDPTAQITQLSYAESEAQSLVEHTTFIYAGVYEEGLTDIEYLTTYAQTRLVLDVPKDMYGYIACQKNMGHPYFIDAASGSPLALGGAEHTDAAVEIEYEDETWLLFRTENSGPAKLDCHVSFLRNTVEAAEALPRLSDSYDLPAQSRLLRVEKPVYLTDSPNLVRFDSNGRATFGNVASDTMVAITTSFRGKTDTKYVKIKSTRVKLDYIRMDCPTSVQGGSDIVVSIDGFYTDGNVRTIKDAKVQVLSPYVLEKKGYRFVTGNPKEPQILHLFATYLDHHNVEHRSVCPVMLNPTAEQLVIEQLTINGPKQLLENNSAQYYAKVLMSDGSIRDVDAVWESSSPMLYIDQQGLATSGKTIDNFIAVLKATLQVDRKKYTSTKNVELIKSYITPASMEILGPSTVLEMDYARYGAYVTWSDGSYTKVNPEWHVDRFSIDETGILSTGSVGAPVSVSILATALGITTNKVAVVYSSPIEIASIRILGPESLKENIMANYKAYAYFTDGNEIEIHPNWAIRGNPSFAYIDDTGTLIFANPSVGILELEATYTYQGKTYEQNKPVVLIPDVPIITGLVVSGESEVLEQQRIRLTAVAVYENGATEVVQPTWSVRSIDPLNVPEVAADIVSSSGLLQGRSVEENTVVIVTARYFKETTEYPVIIKNYDRPGPDIPLFSRIVGPSAILTKDTGSFSLLVVFDNGCNQEIAVSNDWSIDVEPHIAVIDQNGFLRSVNGETTTVTVFADWSCGGHSVHEEFTVRLVAEESTLGELVIYGESNISEQSVTSYRLELFRAGQPPVENTGESPDTTMVEWFLDTHIEGIYISDAGVLFVAHVPNGTNIIIRARYTEKFYAIEKSMQITIGKLLPMYGTGPVGISDGMEMELYLANKDTDVKHGDTLSLNVPNGEYAYFAVPVSYGLVTFTTGEFSSGGMDGATWPDDGSIGLSTGPLTITRISGGVSTDWYIYRSDFPGIGDFSFTVNFL